MMASVCLLEQPAVQRIIHGPATSLAGLCQLDLMDWTLLDEQVLEDGIMHTTSQAQWTHS